MPPMNIRDLALLGSAQPSASVDLPITAYDGITLKLLGDGSAWESLDNFPLSSLKMQTMGGSASNAISAMGGYGNSSYLYDGSADDWGANIGCFYSSQGSAGGANGTTDGQDGAIAFGGNTSGSDSQTQTTIFNGSDWVDGGDLTTSRRECGGGDGNEDSALCLNGQLSAASSYAMLDSSEIYDGSADDWDAIAEEFGDAWNNGFYIGTTTDGLGGMGSDT